jgi:transcriptional regulator with XRE-family HTH domain
MKNMKTKANKLPATVSVDLAKWMKDLIPDTPEMQAIANEEAVRYCLVVALAKARKAAGYTQAQLAKKMGVKQSLISRWENVNQNHTLETLLQLCSAVNAELVMGIKTADEFIPITSATEHHISVHQNPPLENKRNSIGIFGTFLD